MVSTDSCLALSMNEQVLTTMTSASSARWVSSSSALREHAHHDLAVDEVLGTAEADEANLGRFRGKLSFWGVSIKHSEAMVRHAIFLF